MAGANYEVNLQLKADPAVKALERIEKKINTLTKSSVDLQDARGAAMAKNRNLADRINNLEEKGVKVAEMRNRLNKAIEKTDKGKLQTAAAHEQILRREVKKEEKILQVKKEQLKVDRQQTRRRGPGRMQDAILGAGFPLLFGGSPLQALAGGLGGVAGGFAGSIAGSAIASQLEGFARAATETGVALTSTAGTLELMREKSLFSSEAARERAAELENLGEVEKLAAHLSLEMAKAVGNEGVKALQDLGETTKETTRLWNLLTTQLFRLVSGPLDAFLKAMNNVLGGLTVEQQFRARREDLGDTEFGFALENRVKELMEGDTSNLNPTQLARGKGRGVGAMSRIEAMRQALSEEMFQVRPREIIPVTAEDRRTITPGKTREKAGRRSRIPDLNAEIGLQERLLTLNNQIAEAKRNENPIREAALQMETALEKQAAKIQQIDAKRIPEAEKILEKQLLELQTDKEILKIQNRLKDIQATQAEKAKDTIDGLLAEQALLQATLNGKEEEVRLEQRINEILEENPKLTEKEVKQILEANEALKKKIKLQEQSDALYKKITGTIENGIVDGIMSAVEGTKSLAESLSGVLRQLARMFLTQGIGSFGKDGEKGTGLLGVLGFADGGRPPVGRPSIVGERGPELFVPDRAGTIIPNHALGSSASVTVNVDASGSSVEGNADQASQLGKAIGIAVQAELVKQKRPGGLLAS